MSPRKTKIEVTQVKSLTTSKLRYVVSSLTNRTRPEIGHELSEDELKQLITESEGLTVVVKPGKDKR